MFERIKAALAWFYEWATVVSASLLGFLSVIPEMLSALDAVDLKPILPPDKAMAILTCVAIVKAVTAMIKKKVESD